MVDESGAGAEPKYVLVPPGFPRTLTDTQLEETVATYAEGLRRTADAVASGMTNQAVVLVHVARRRFV